MTDPELVRYIRESVPRRGLPATRADLISDGVDPEEVDAAVAQAAGRNAPSRGRLALCALLGAAALTVAAALSLTQGGGPRTPSRAPEARGGVFRGHRGYSLRLPPGYEATSVFRDPSRTVEVVYVFPEGTDPEVLPRQALYADLGILRLEVYPQRLPRGRTGLDLMKAWAARRLEQEKASFDTRRLRVNGMPAFVAMVESPFRSVTAYVVGRRLRYTLVGGEETPLFDAVLSSIEEL